MDMKTDHERKNKMALEPGSDNFYHTVQSSNSLSNKNIDVRSSFQKGTNQLDFHQQAKELEDVKNERAIQTSRLEKRAH